MIIRKANTNDSESIKNLYLQAFDVSEAELVSNLAVNLLHEKTPIAVLSLVAIDNDEIIAHVAFSPIFLDEANECFGYILAPLAVLPQNQKSRVGSSIVKYGLDTIVSLGPNIVLVYGDPKYYSRFGFNTDLAKNLIAPYPLEHPEGLHAMRLGTANSPNAGKFSCVNSLNIPELW